MKNRKKEKIKRKEGWIVAFLRFGEIVNSEDMNRDSILEAKFCLDFLEKVKIPKKEIIGLCHSLEVELVHLKRELKAVEKEDITVYYDPDEIDTFTQESFKARKLTTVGSLKALIKKLKHTTELTRSIIQIS